MLAACVKNDLGQLLTYTTRPFKSQVEEYALELWGMETWALLRRAGAMIVSVEVTEVA